MRLRLIQLFFIYSFLKLDGPLAQMFGLDENVQMEMEVGINKFIGKMTLMKEITTDRNSNIIQNGKVKPIDISVSFRRIRKRVFMKTDKQFVTFINNLEMFGIKLEKFREDCAKIGAGASISEVLGKKRVLVQGNQVSYVLKLLRGNSVKTTISSIT